MCSTTTEGRQETAAADSSPAACCVAFCTLRSILGPSMFWLEGRGPEGGVRGKGCMRKGNRAQLLLLLSCTGSVKKIIASTGITY
jgi:hypothetical protein